MAVSRRLPALEYVCKPGATAAFLATAATIDATHGAPWGWRIAALGFCVVGDVFLMLPRDSFVPGLASFAVAQVLFAISFVSGGIDGARLLAGFLLVAPVVAVLAWRFIGGLARAGTKALIGPVAAYMVIIAAMSVSAVAAGSTVAIAGAAMFLVSDSLIAETRFVSARSWHPVGIMVTYHLALAGLTLGLV